MAKRALSLLLLALAGALVGALGSAGYRSLGYGGVVIALVLVASAGLFAKAWHSWTGFCVYAVTWVVTVGYLSQRGPGGDVLIPAHDTRASLWLYGGAVVMALVATIPPVTLVGRDVAP